MAENFFPPKNLVYIFWREKFSFHPPPTFLPFPTHILLSTTTPPTSRRSCSSIYQMSLLLSADPGTLWTRTAEPWVAGPSSFPLNLIERTILILELRDELWDQGILTENFLTPRSWRRSVSNCWSLDYWAVILSTRPRSSCWENNFRSSWWSVRSRNLNRTMRSSYLNRKYSKSTSLNLNCARPRI